MITFMNIFAMALLMRRHNVIDYENTAQLWNSLLLAKPQHMIVRRLQRGGGSRPSNWFGNRTLNLILQNPASLIKFGRLMFTFKRL